MARALCFTFIPLAQKLVPVLIEELAASVKGRKIAFADAPAVHDAGRSASRTWATRALAQDGALHVRHGAARRAGARGRRAALQAARRQGRAAAHLQQLRPRHHGAAARRRARPASWWPSTAASPTSSCAWAASTRQTRSPPTRRVRSAVGPDVLISGRLQPGACPRAARSTPAVPSTDLGLAWIEEPVAYDDYDTPGAARRQAGDTRPDRRELVELARRQGGDRDGRLRLRHAGPAAHRRRHRLDAARPRRRGARRAVLLPPLARLSPRTCWPPRRPGTGWSSWTGARTCWSIRWCR